MVKDLVIFVSYMINWPTLFFFSLSLFRFKLKPFIPQVIFCSIILTNISLLIQNSNFLFLLSALQFFSAWLFVWIIFRLRLVHSFFIIIIGYIVMSIIEWLMNITFPITVIKEITLSNLNLFFWSGILLNSFCWLVIMMIRKLRIGFSFIPTSRIQGRYIFKGSPFLSIVLIAGLSIIFVNSIALFFFPKLYYGIFVLEIVILTFIMRKSYQWELDD